MTQASSIAAAAALVSADAAILHAVVTGPATGGTSLVDVGGGEMVRTLARASAELSAFLAGGGDFTLPAKLNFGGSTSSFPSLKRSGASIQARLADDSAYANFLASNVLVEQSGSLLITNRGGLSATADGLFMLTNAAGTDFSLLMLGGSSSSFPALKRSGASFQVRLADDSDYANLLAANITVPSAGGFLFTSRGSLYAPADGRLLMANAAGSDFGRLMLGGTTSSFPALKRNGGAIEVRLADDSAYADLFASNVLLAGSLLWPAKFSINSPSDGNLRLTNAAGSGFTSLLFATGASTDVGIYPCTGTPEGAVTARIGSIALRLDGGANTSIYVKESGTGNTGWVAK